MHPYRIVSTGDCGGGGGPAPKKHRANGGGGGGSSWSGGSSTAGRYDGGPPPAPKIRYDTPAWTPTQIAQQKVRENHGAGIIGQHTAASTQYCDGQGYPACPSSEEADWGPFIEWLKQNSSLAIFAIMVIGMVLTALFPAYWILLTIISVILVSIIYLVVYPPLVAAMLILAQVIFVWRAAGLALAVASLVHGVIGALPKLVGQLVVAVVDAIGGAVVGLNWANERKRNRGKLDKRCTPGIVC